MENGARTPASRPKVAILSLDFYPQTGGVQTYLYEIFRRLADRYQVTAVTPVPGEFPPESGIRKVIVNGRCFFGFWRALRQLRPDKVVVGHAHPQLLLAAYLSRIPYAAVTHGNDFHAAQGRWHRPLFNWLLRRAQPLIANSNATAGQLAQLGMGEPAVVYPGTDPQRFRPGEVESRRPLTLLTVGRLVPRKGVDLVLPALASLRRRFPQLRYLVAGDGPDAPRLRQLVQQLELSAAVEFLGRVSDEDLPSLYRRATIFVMPAREIAEAGSVEGFGIVYLEAAASGLPVVAARSGGAVEAVRDGETGLLVEPDDAQGLIETLERLLSDDALRRRLGENGRRWVETEMNWGRAAEEMQTLLAVIDGRPAEVR